MPRPHLALSARRFAALGDPTRLQVFLLLSREPQSVAEVARYTSVSRPAVSQHLKVLGGLSERQVVSRRANRRIAPELLLGYAKRPSGVHRTFDGEPCILD